MADGESVKNQLEAEIVSIWLNVLKTVNRLIEADEKFGFGQFEEKITPSIDHIVHGLTAIDSILSLMLDTDLLEYDESRQALNAKQCILHIRALSRALKSKDEDEYVRVITLLQSQSKF